MRCRAGDLQPEWRLAGTVPHVPGCRVYGLGTLPGTLLETGTFVLIAAQFNFLFKWPVFSACVAIVMARMLTLLFLLV